MSDQVKQLLDIPRDFIKDGAFFLNRCTKPSRKGTLSPLHPNLVLIERADVAKNLLIFRGLWELDSWLWGLLDLLSS
jgi:hypothetical protein